MNQICIGLFGNGVVGKGFRHLISATGGAVIKKIAVRYPAKHPTLQAPLLAASKEEVILDEDVNVIVEAIDDEVAAFGILQLALQHKKPVITANKKMVARYLPEIIRLQIEHKTPVLYEAACCAGVPVVRLLQDYYHSATINKLEGIINGSTNYILTAMQLFRFKFDHALQLAQEAGFAESDASLDVEGKDGLHKLCILVRHLWSAPVAIDQIVHTGIQNLLPQDLRLAEQLQGCIKLVAVTERTGPGSINAYLLPRLVLKQDPLFQVSQENNGLVIEDLFKGQHFLHGKGSGGLPTATGLWNDIVASRRGYRYQYIDTGSECLSLDYGKEIAVHLSVAAGQFLPATVSGRLHEYAADGSCRYWTGRLSLDELRQDDWWKQEGVSLLDISGLEAEDELELLDHLKTALALQKDIFQPV
ncbi:homoserine dehydrogenase [Taibaiella chishuiensis]|uniref:Homoserine dehydrogenase n=1 Tax=Taibaiella chishuiensis TaxID=1434707 RepID=A0A2P8CZD9_9BACT|nr:homoserine dehydrogenase [Taibaiella chishuiensis]PSK90330.1 homoserine dehydrogenase [Taibaiella chishuiensis]